MLFGVIICAIVDWAEGRSKHNVSGFAQGSSAFPITYESLNFQVPLLFFHVENPRGAHRIADLFGAIFEPDI